MAAVEVMQTSVVGLNQAKDDLVQPELVVLLPNTKQLAVDEAVAAIQQQQLDAQQTG
jgi:hypothetical protein